MIPLCITVQGFMSYRERQTVDFAGAPLWVLAGANGSGKSTLFDAVTVALYGCHRDGTQHLDELINHHADNFQVQFDFELAGALYRVKRTEPRRGAGTRAVFTIDRDGGEHPVSGSTNARGFERWRDSVIGLSADAFLSCVILRQGDSDALLNAKPKERFEILANLIDLSSYQKLHERVDLQRRQRNTRAKILNEQLTRMPRVTDADLNAAQDEFDMACAATETAQKRVSDLTVLMEQNRQWAQLTARLEHVHLRQERIQALLDNAADIQRGAERWTALERALPRLRTIVATRDRLDAVTRAINDAEPALVALKDAESIANDGVIEAMKRVGDLSSRVASLRTDHRATFAQRQNDERIVDRLISIQQAEQQIKQLQVSIAHYPDDLLEQITAGELRERELSELRQVQLWLQQIAQQRALLPAQVIAQAIAEEHQSVAHAHQVDVTESFAFAAHALEVAEQAERLANNALQQAQTYHGTAVRSLERFENTAQEPTCSACGQPITPEHTEQERSRLQAAIDETSGELEAARSELAVRQDALRVAQSTIDTKRAALADAELAVRNADQSYDAAVRAVAAIVFLLHQAWDQLPDAYRARVSNDALDPSDHAVWSTTTWPTSDDIAVINTDVAELDGLRTRLTSLREKQTSFAGLQGQRDADILNLQSLTANFDRAAAERTCGTLPETAALEQRLAAELTAAEAEHEAARIETESARRQADTARTASAEAERELAVQRQVAHDATNRLQDELSHLDADWRASALECTMTVLDGFTAEHRSLAAYPDQARQLMGANATLAELQRQGAETSAQIAELPEDARQPADVVAAQLSDAEESFTRSNTLQSDCQSTLDALSKDRIRYDEQAQLVRLADRDARLHKRLADLLGRTGLQMTLLRQAEKGVVQEANAILDRLSGGRMRLELRDDDAQVDAALDLLYRDDETATRPIPIALASGSQRFRIAVSLALAVGRYLGNESQRIQSVIIDEGFGSLDRAGRGDMIQVLGELQSQLKRIILVSHQEEIADAFPNCYQTCLIDGASRVSLERAV